MKTVFTLLTILLIWFAAPAQTLEGFFGFPFGSSIQLVRNGLAAKPGCVIDEQASGSDKIVMTNTPFAGRTAKLFVMQFIDDKLYKGYVVIPPVTEGKVISLYEQIKSELNTKYFETNDIIETYKYPYEKGDSRTLAALKLEKADLLTTWIFEQGNMIRIVVTPKLEVMLMYYDGQRYLDARKITQAQNANDY